MERTLLEQHLAQAEQHVALGELHIAKQLGIIAELERNGHDSTIAKTLLTTFLETKEIHVSDRDRLREEIKRLS